MLYGYLDFARAKKNKEDLEKKNPQKPVLNDEDEQFLHRIASNQEAAAAAPAKSESSALASEQTVTELDHTEDVKTQGSAVDSKTDDAATTKKTDGAENTTTGNTAKSQEASTESKEAPGTSSESPSFSPSKRTWASYIPSMPSVPAVPTVSLPTWRSKTDSSSSSGPEQGASASSTDTPTNPPGVTITENVQLSEAKQAEDEKDVSVLLDRLSFSSINNRVFSFSDKTEKIYNDFTVVLKDMMNGAPTAYEDMENLLKNNDAYLRETFVAMPPFVQTLVKSLPSKLGTTLGPEILAAASEKPGADLKARMASASSPSSSKTANKKNKKNVPSVQKLADQKGAVAGMLRSIVSFLQTRFPAFVTGTNVIMSLAVFILLFVFWYCHKRGRETRLAKEGADAASLTESSETEGTDEELSDEKDGVNVMDNESEEKAAGEDDGVATGDAERVDDKAVEAAESVLNQPEPKDVPLPETSEAQK